MTTRCKMWKLRRSLTLPIYKIASSDSPSASRAIVKHTVPFDKLRELADWIALTEDDTPLELPIRENLAKSNANVLIVASYPNIEVEQTAVLSTLISPSILGGWSIGERHLLNHF